MFDYSLNVGGSEWMIIIFVALVLILGTGKLPGAARKMGQAVNEYNKAKNEIQNHMKEVTDEPPKISGPVETEREKLEMIAKSIGVKTEGKTDDDLRESISTKIGQKKVDESEKK
jgi:sec-independent protein translocase protein TatA